MLVTLKTDKKQLRFNDKIKCTVVIDEIDWGDFHECSFTLLINGLRAETVYKRIGCEANITDITKPIDLEFYPSVFSFDGGIGKNSYVEISLLTRFSGRHIFEKTESGRTTINVDLSDVRVLRTEGGKTTRWVAHRNTIYFASPYVTTVKHKKTTADINYFRIPDGAIHGKYLCDSDHVYCDGFKLKNVSSEHFVVFNRCFAGDKFSIFTVYGNAKVKHPWHFKVLDDGNVNNDDVYVSGYGRDDIHVYWFNGSTGTGHATVVRSCKKPHTFRSIKSGYGIDDDFVYYEAVKIPKANPKTWTMINNNYSKDDKNVFYFRKLVVGADLESFEIIPDACFPDIDDSCCGKDKNRTYETGTSVTTSNRCIVHQ